VPSAVKIARYWVQQRPGVFAITTDHPKCFHCGSEIASWAKLERAHLVDRALGGLDHEANLVLLCRVCHRERMPSYGPDEAEAAIAWVANPNAPTRDEQMDEEIIRYAHMQADEAPPFTTEQAMLLVSVFSRYPADGDEREPTT
jgi:hypothetical protein